MSDIKISEFEKLSSIGNSNSILIPVAYNGNNYSIPLSVLSGLYMSSSDTSISDLQDKIEEILDTASGNDNLAWEFVFKLTKTSTESISAPLTSTEGYYTDDYKPVGWDDDASAVSAEYPYCWASIRLKKNSSTWGDFTDPYLWSKYGKDGRDGNGIEYIYKATSSPLTSSEKQISNILSSDIYSNYETNEDYQTDEYVPNSEWTDDPIDLDSSSNTNEDGSIKYRYQYVCTRKYNGVTKRWGLFSDARLWNYKAQDGNDGSSSTVATLTNEHANIQFVRDGNNLKAIDSNGTDDGFATTLIYIQIGTQYVTPTSLQVAIPGNDYSTVTLGTNTTVDGVTFIATKTNVGYKINVVGCEYLNKTHNLDFKLNGTLDDDIYSGNKIFSISEIIPGADGHSTSYELMYSASGISCDSDGYNPNPESIVVQVRKIVDGEISIVSDFSDENLIIRAYQNQIDGDDIKIFDTEDGTLVTEGVSSSDNSITFGIEVINDTLNYIRVDLLQTQNSELYSWDTQSFHKTKDGETPVFLRFDKAQECVFIDSDGNAVLDDLDDISIDFGLYKGTEILESSQFIDNKINDTTVTEGILILFGNTDLTSLCNITRYDTTDENLKNKFKLIIPFSSVIDPYILDNGTNKGKDSVIRFTNQDITVKVNYYSNETTSHGVVGYFTISKAIRGNDGVSGYTITAVNDSVLLDDDTISDSTIQSISNGQIHIYSLTSEITDKCTYEIESHLPTDLTPHISSSGAFYISSTKTTGQWDKGNYYFIIKITYNGTVIGSKTITVKIAQFSVGETYGLLIEPNIIQYYPGNFDIVDTAKPKIYVKIYDGNTDYKTDNIINDYSVYQTGSTYLKLYPIGQEGNPITLIKNGSYYEPTSNLTYNEKGYNAKLIIGNNESFDSELIECRVIQKSVYINNDNNTVYIDNDCDDNSDLKTLTEVTLNVYDNGIRITDPSKYSISYSASDMPEAFTIKEGIYNSSGTSFYLYVDRDKLNKLNNLNTSKTSLDLRYLPDGNFVITYNITYNGSVYTTTQNIIIKELGESSGYKLIASPTQIHYSIDSTGKLVTSLNVSVDAYIIDHGYQYVNINNIISSTIESGKLYYRVYKSSDASSNYENYTSLSKISETYNAAGYTIDLIGDISIDGNIVTCNVYDSITISCVSDGENGSTSYYKYLYAQEDYGTEVKQPTLTNNNTGWTNNGTNWVEEQPEFKIGKYIWTTQSLVTISSLGNITYGEFSTPLRISGYSFETMYSPNETINYPDNISAGNADGWTTTWSSDIIWMTIKNASGKWQTPIRLSGKDGTSIKILGTYSSISILQVCTKNETFKDSDGTVYDEYLYAESDIKSFTYSNGVPVNAEPNDNATKIGLNIGDCYVIGTTTSETKELYIWKGESWFSAGNIKGTPGAQCYVHIKYADSIDNENETVTLTNNDGEDYGPYMGICSDYTQDDPTENLYNAYSWSKIQGDPGEDADDIEYIYCNSNTQSEIDNYSNQSEYNGKTFDVDDFVPEYWTDHPSGVSNDNQTEYVCSRKSTKVNGKKTWGEFTSPVVWSHWGDKGNDGDGFEYIFIRTKTDSTPIYKPNDDAGSDTYTDDPSYDESGNQKTWTDDPTGVTLEYPYEWVSTRRYNGTKWDKWSTPTKWAIYATNGESTYTLELDNDFVVIDKNVSTSDLQEISACKATLKLGTDNIDESEYTLKPPQCPDEFTISKNATSGKWVLSLSGEGELSEGDIFNITFKAIDKTDSTKILAQRVQTVRVISIASGGGYKLSISPNSIAFEKDDNNNVIDKTIPVSITPVVSLIQNGEVTEVTDYSVRLQNGTDSVNTIYIEYPEKVNYSEGNFSISKYNSNGYTFNLYYKSGSDNILIDSETIDVVLPGNRGQQGASAQSSYSLILSNDSLALDDNTIDSSIISGIGGTATLYQGQTDVNEYTTYSIKNKDLPSGLDVVFNNTTKSYNLSKTSDVESWSPRVYSFDIEAVYSKDDVNETIVLNVKVPIYNISKGETYNISTNIQLLIFNKVNGSTTTVDGGDYTPHIQIEIIGGQSGQSYLSKSVFDNDNFSKRTAATDDNHKFYLILSKKLSVVEYSTTPISLEYDATNNYWYLSNSNSLKTYNALGYDILLYEDNYTNPIDVEHIDCLVNGQDGAGEYSVYISPTSDIIIDDETTTTILLNYYSREIIVYDKNGNQLTKDDDCWIDGSTFTFTDVSGDSPVIVSDYNELIFEYEAGSLEFHLEKADGIDKLTVGLLQVKIDIWNKDAYLPKSVMFNVTIKDVGSDVNYIIKTTPAYYSDESTLEISPTVEVKKVTSGTNTSTSLNFEFNTETPITSDKLWIEAYTYDNLSSPKKLTAAFNSNVATISSLPYSNGGYYLTLNKGNGKDIAYGKIDCIINPNYIISNPYSGTGLFKVDTTTNKLTFEYTPSTITNIYPDKINVVFKNIIENSGYKDLTLEFTDVTKQASIIFDGEGFEVDGITGVTPTNFNSYTLNTGDKINWINCLSAEVQYYKNDIEVYTETISRTGMDGHYFNVSDSGLISLLSADEQISDIKQTADEITLVVNNSGKPNLIEDSNFKYTQSIVHTTSDHDNYDKAVKNWIDSSSIEIDFPEELDSSDYYSNAYGKIIELNSTGSCSDTDFSNVYGKPNSKYINYGFGILGKLQNDSSEFGIKTKSVTGLKKTLDYTISTYILFISEYESDTCTLSIYFGDLEIISKTVQSGTTWSRINTEKFKPLNTSGSIYFRISQNLNYETTRPIFVITGLQLEYGELGEYNPSMNDAFTRIDLTANSIELSVANQVSLQLNENSIQAAIKNTYALDANSSVTYLANRKAGFASMASVENSTDNTFAGWGESMSNGSPIQDTSSDGKTNLYNLVPEKLQGLKFEAGAGYLAAGNIVWDGSGNTTISGNTVIEGDAEVKCAVSSPLFTVTGTSANPNLDNGIMWITTIANAKLALVDYGYFSSVDEIDISGLSNADETLPIFLIKQGSQFYVLNPLAIKSTSNTTAQKYILLTGNETASDIISKYSDSSSVSNIYYDSNNIYYTDSNCTLKYTGYTLSSSVNYSPEYIPIYDQNDPGELYRILNNNPVFRHINLMYELIISYFNEGIKENTKYYYVYGKVTNTEEYTSSSSNLKSTIGSVYWFYTTKLMVIDGTYYVVSDSSSLNTISGSPYTLRITDGVSSTNTLSSVTGFSTSVSSYETANASSNTQE